MKTLSIAEARRDFCSIAADVAESGEPVVVSRYGAPFLMITAYRPEAVQESPRKAAKPASFKDSPLFGMWADREEMADPRAWIEKMRGERRKRIGLE